MEVNLTLEDALHGLEEEATDMDDLEPTEAESESESEISGQVVLVSGRKLSDSNIQEDEDSHPAYANSDFYMKHKPDLIQKPPNTQPPKNSDFSSDSGTDIQDKAFLKQYKNEKSEGKLLNL